MYLAMLDAADRYSLDCSSLRACMVVGEPLPATVSRRFENRFGCVVLDRYAVAETPVAFG
jgi:long-chain acyl-CoA synthetase